MHAEERLVEVAPGHALSLLCRALGAANGAADAAAGVSGGDVTACDLWLAATRVLCAYLARHAAAVLHVGGDSPDSGTNNIGCRSARVLELGCGAAACPGILAARLGAARVLLTDGDAPALALAAENASRNGVGAACSTVLLQWSAEAQPGEPSDCWDVLLACEAVYATAAAVALAATAARLLSPHGVLLLAHQERFALSLDKHTGQVRVAAADESLSAFCDLLTRAGVLVRVLCRRCSESAQRGEGDLLLLAASRALVLSALPECTSLYGVVV
jgi:2-polyprenyl-3-methyl-5-hydroxy-6-metoxy-1,4-benzoquinol methylase